jgi:hypothetical protein
MSARKLRAIPPARKTRACRHKGFYAATTRYDRRAGVMCFVLVCEGCGAEVQEVERVAYRPRFAAHRNPPLAA